MKTFKMISIQVDDGEKFKDFPLRDGIIINQENSHRMWILEMYIDGEHEDFFRSKISQENLVDTKVVISYPENEPAAFRVAIDKVKKIRDNISVLMKGRLKRARSQYAEQLLEELLDEGYEGDALLAQFEESMRSRPRLKKDKMKDEA